ncbi:MAG: ChaN family lipoprotein [Gemmatimonadales bacterium]
MRTLRFLPIILAAACGGAATTAVAPVSFTMPDSTSILDGATGAPVTTGELLRRVGGSDIVLLGEVHDNPVDHALRGSLITAFASKHPAIVFEQFTDRDQPIPSPAAGEAKEDWLDTYGFDRRSWKWPLHQPVVDAAIAHGRSLWGSNLSRQALRDVVMQGESAAPEPLRELSARAPLDSAGVAVMDAELVEGHCGQLPESMIPGMRSAQVIRDAAMTRAIMQARADGRGPVWLIAGNGHVRTDLGVPRLLRQAAPGASVLAVGLLEREADGSAPPAAERRRYDLVIVTPKTEREDPCKELMKN